MNFLDYKNNNVDCEITDCSIRVFLYDNVDCKITDCIIRVFSNNKIYVVCKVLKQLCSCSISLIKSNIDSLFL